MERLDVADFGFELMVPGGSESTWGLAEEQSQVLAMTCFAPRNNFSSLNAFSQEVKLQYISTSVGKLSPPGEGRCVSRSWVASGATSPLLLGQ